ncbi:hypothetical protein BOTBODRAFT_287254 [Botryobasidium botryosum FD-172 SS1]|uniref:Uncharacterized protein n=1 Tax=Botryobasidium botryosum (strain FD-172 SS1) TaxID=930990 RepID=A0A067MW23_BOTB1|nr:hypothetical protein BOTBODRAFT_287254 [Botryobasidium botryosum FD-172 SS1]
MTSLELNPTRTPPAPPLPLNDKKLRDVLRAAWSQGKHEDKVIIRNPTIIEPQNLDIDLDERGSAGGQVEGVLREIGLILIDEEPDGPPPEDANQPRVPALRLGEFAALHHNNVDNRNGLEVVPELIKLHLWLFEQWASTSPVPGQVLFAGSLFGLVAFHRLPR